MVSQHLENMKELIQPWVTAYLPHFSYFQWTHGKRMKAVKMDQVDCILYSFAFWLSVRKSSLLVCIMHSCVCVCVAKWFLCSDLDQNSDWKTKYIERLWRGTWFLKMCLCLWTQHWVRKGYSVADIVLQQPARLRSESPPRQAFHTKFLSLVSLGNKGLWEAPN